MKISQVITVIAALAAVSLIYIFGSTRYPVQKPHAHESSNVTGQEVLEQAREQLSQADLKHLQHLEEDLHHARTKADSLAAYNSLGGFWYQRAKNYHAAAFFQYEKAKLENSEKSLTFAANFLLGSAMADERNPLMRSWKSTLAQELFEKALQFNPAADSLKIGLGGTYMFGAGGPNPMTGISMIREVVAKDSTNAYAHKMLGFGNIENGQMDKAIERFQKSLTYNPKDLGLLIMIPMLYKQKGDAVNANVWYKRVKQEIKDPELFREFDAQFQSLK